MRKFLITEKELKVLFDYGIDRLSEKTDQPHPDLARYFASLASIEGIEKDLEDIATDAMVLCENDNDFPVPSSREEIVERYKKLPA